MGLALILRLGPRKLWHLAAMVAAVAVVLSVPVEILKQLMGIGIFLGISSPAFWAGTAWDRYLGRCHEMGQPANRLIESVFFRAAWFAGILLLYWMGLILALILLLGRN